MRRGRPEPETPADADEPEDLLPEDVLPGDVLEGGMRPAPWRRRWTALPRAARLSVAGLVVLLAAAGGGLWLRDRAAERALAQRVDVAASFSVSSLSTTPPGGQVAFFLVVRNEGVRPVWVTSVGGGDDGLVLGTHDEVERQVAPHGEASVPVSVRLTCDRYAGGGGLTAEIGLRRTDGSTVIRRSRPDPASALTEVATTLCAVRPDLRDQELSGPVLDDLAAGDLDR